MGMFLRNVNIVKKGSRLEKKILNRNIVLEDAI